MATLAEMYCVFQKRNLAGKNGVYDVRCHLADSPIFICGTAYL